MDTHPLVVVGLGNPGPRFTGTRHNAGFMIVDRLSAVLGIELRRPLAKRTVLFGTGKGPHQGHVMLAKPLTFMNRSGSVIPFLLRRAGATAEHLLVVVDNMDLSPGEIRMKRRGGDSSHNGLRSVSQAVGGNDYARLYVGVGRPADSSEVIDHVLSVFPANEQAVVASAVNRAAVACAQSYPSMDTLISHVNAHRHMEAD